jgi:hypothetical protein
MADTTAVIAAAEQLDAKDEEALALEIGLRSRHIEGDPSGADNPFLSVAYGTHMGLIDDVKALGWRILARWNKELYAVICSSKKPEDKELSKKVFAALSLGEAALIAAIAPALLWIGAPAAIAAVVAPLIVKKFIVPAKEELCAAWEEAITAQK